MDSDEDKDISELYNVSSAVYRDRYRYNQYLKYAIGTGLLLCTEKTLYGRIIRGGGTFVDIGGGGGLLAEYMGFGPDGDPQSVDILRFLEYLAGYLTYGGIFFPETDERKKDEGFTVRISAEGYSARDFIKFDRKAGLFGHKNRIIIGDISFGMLRSGYISHPLLEYINCKGESMPFRRNILDGAVSFTAFQNFTDIEKGITEVLGICRRGTKHHTPVLITILGKKEEYIKRISQILFSYSVTHYIFRPDNEFIRFLREAVRLFDRKHGTFITYELEGSISGNEDIYVVFFIE